MLIAWSPEQQAMKDELRQFVEATIEPRREDLEHGALPPYDILRSLFSSFELDVLAKERFERAMMPPSSETGPRHRNADDIAIVLLPMIEISRCSPGIVTAMGVSANLAPGAILKQGTPEQKERWALDLMTMAKVGAWAITEPDSGSDAFGGMRAIAVQSGNGFVLNGAKTFITNGPYADTIVFICRLVVDGVPDEQRPIATFVLERGMTGLEQTKPLRKMGMHSSPTGQLFLSDVEVGVEHLLGGEKALATMLSLGKSPTSRGSGSAGAKGAFASERASIAATAMGIIDRCLELSVDYARTRVQFGKTIGQYQLIQEKLALMEVARLNVQNLIFRYMECLVEGRGISFAEASAMKLYSARAAVEVAMEAVQLFGGNGYMSEYPVEQLARDAKVLQIYAGTDEMQIRGIAKSLLSQS
jgi:alkylation response protein AidB-like acyl-CoA dehydrogenase